MTNESITCLITDLETLTSKLKNLTTKVYPPGVSSEKYKEIGECLVILRKLKTSFNFLFLSFLAEKNEEQNNETL